MAGDRQNTPFPNANGCNTFSAAAYRGNSAAANIWENLVCTGANGTVPHADSRVLAFDPSGNLLLGNDGGIYRLNTPDAIATRRWSSLNGDLRTLEMHSVAYDPVSQVLFGGAQDNGTPIQTTPGSFTWSTFFGADGGVVAVDTDQAVHPGTSIRYVTTQRLGAFTRSFWNAGNNLIGTATQLQLRITSGGGAGQVLGQDPNVQ